MRLSPEQRTLLAALQQGAELKVHRTPDGGKRYQLHWPPDSSSTSRVDVLANRIVIPLESAGILSSNMKFPAATFLLTEKGARLAAQLTGQLQAPTGPRGFR